MSTMRVTRSYNATCAVCGWKYKASELRKRWDGHWVCEYDWEPRHILDFYKPPRDERPLPFISPELEVDIGPAIYVPPGSGPPSFTCTPVTRLSKADFGTAGCMTVGVLN